MCLAMWRMPYRSTSGESGGPAVCCDRVAEDGYSLVLVHCRIQLAEARLVHDHGDAASPIGIDAGIVPGAAIEDGVHTAIIDQQTGHALPCSSHQNANQGGIQGGTCTETSMFLRYKLANYAPPNFPLALTL